MAKPTILIGIGTSGLYVLENVQNFYFENTGKNKPDHVEYLYIETNKDNQPSVTALDNEIKRVYMSLGEMEKMVESIKNDTFITSNWVPPSERLVDEGLGAGGIPSCGRLALWGKNNEGNNFVNVMNAIRNAYSKVGNHTVEGVEDNKPAVFVTGSLVGGTGTGIFIDMAFIIRHIIDDIQELNGLFLMPPRPVSYKGMEVIYSNSYSAYWSLNYFNDAEKKYHVNWPNHTEYSSNKPPYQLVQFLTQDYNDGSPPISSLGGLFKMAGLYLFLNIFGLRAKRQERLVDAFGNGHLKYYDTFGISAIQYPKTQIQEHIALNLSIQLLERFVDSSNYYIQGYKTPIDRSAISNEMIESFDTILREAFSALNVVGGRNLEADIKKQATLINKGDIEGNRDDYVTKLFSSNNTGNYYDAVRNNIQVAVDVIIMRIAELVKNSVNTFENLYVAKSQLDSLIKALNETLKYWNSLGLSFVPAKWEDLLRRQTKWMLKGRYKALLEQDNVLEDRLGTTLDLMKMHLISKKLVDIRQNITEGDIPYPTDTLPDRYELPRLNVIEDMIDEISQTVGRVESYDEPAGFKTLRRRKSDIESEMEDETIPILRVFPNGTFLEEVEKSYQQYLRKTNKSYPSKTTVIGQQNLWDYLQSAHSRTMKKVLYGDFIQAFERELNQTESVPDYEVSEYIENNPKEAVRIAKRSLAPLLLVNKPFEDSPYIPKVIIGSDSRKIRKIVQIFRDDNFSDFKDKDDNILEIRNLKNVVVFYVERGMLENRTFNPLKDITYLDQVKAKFEAYPKDVNIPIERWHNYRFPYVPLATYQKVENEMKEENLRLAEQKLKENRLRKKDDELRRMKEKVELEKIKQKEAEFEETRKKLEEEAKLAELKKQEAAIAKAEEELKRKEEELKRQLEEIRNKKENLGDDPVSDDNDSENDND
ncbi:MAG: tubulin-like doman-containing protein [Bacteroidota bacterium]